MNCSADDDHYDKMMYVVLARLGRLIAGEFSEQQQQRQVMDRVSKIDQNADDVSRSTGRLSFSIYALLGWVSLVTVAVAAVAVVTLRRRRRRGRLPVDINVAVETEREWTRSLASVEGLSVSPSSSSSQVISVNE